MRLERVGVRQELDLARAAEPLVDVVGQLVVAADPFERPHDAGVGAGEVVALARRGRLLDAVAEKVEAAGVAELHPSQARVARAERDEVVAARCELGGLRERGQRRLLVVGEHEQHRPVGGGQRVGRRGGHRPVDRPRARSRSSAFM